MSNTSFSFKFDSLLEVANFRKQILEYYEKNHEEAPSMDISKLPNYELTIEGFSDIEKTTKLLDLISKIDS